MTLVVFALDEEVSFRNVKSWIDQIRNESPETLIGLVGNKSDVTSRQVGLGEACDFAASEGISYTETSAVTGENIENVFVKLITEYLEQSMAAVHSEQPSQESPKNNTSEAGVNLKESRNVHRKRCRC
jgi:hypothetical protein